MDYGEVFVGSFKMMWRHKKLWGFGMLGYLLVALATAIYTPLTYDYMRDWMSTVSQIAESGQPEAAFGDLMASMIGLWIGAGLVLIASLISYLVNLVMRGATINEAMHAWRGDRTRTRRGLGAGLGRAVYIFALDLLWGIPPAVVGAGAYVLAFASLILPSTGRNSDDPGLAAFLAFCGVLCCGLCLTLFLILLRSIFSPLMYQSAVQGRRGLGEAIREGWQLARANLGTMIAFALLLFGVWIVFYFLMQAISLPLSLPFIQPWIEGMNRIMEDIQSGGAPTWSMAPLNPALLVIIGLITGLVTLLSNGFQQALTLTLYAEVYRRLTADRPIAGGLAPLPIGPAGPVASTRTPLPETPNTDVTTSSPPAQGATPPWRPVVADEDSPAPIVPDEDDTPKDEHAPYV